MVASSRFFFQLNDGEQLYASSLPGNCLRMPSANCFACARSGVEVSHQTRSAYGAYARPRAMAVSTPALDAVEALGRALALDDERPVALVDVAREQLRAVGVGARDERRVGTPQTSAARRAATSVRMNCAGRDRAPCRPCGRTSSRSRAGPRSERPRRPPRSSPFISSNALSGPPKPASASAMIGASQ